MLNLARGQKVPLSNLTPTLKLQVRLEMVAKTLSFDLSCFGLDADNQLSDDRYFVFFNQKGSPQNEVVLTSLSPRAARFEIDLARLPPAVRRLVFVATVDGAGQMSDLESGRFVLSAGGEDVGEFAFSGSDFSTEKAVMVSEIYFKDQWRVAANGQGFKDGLNAVLKHFGGQEVEESAPEQMQLAPKTPVRAVEMAPPEPRRVEFSPPAHQPGQTVNLQKRQTVSLSKMAPQGLREIRMGLGWDPAQSGRRVDLDASCIAFDAQKKVLETVWFGHLRDRGGTISHSGDNLTGRGEGDDEVITVDLARLSPQVQTLVFTRAC